MQHPVTHNSKKSSWEPQSHFQRLGANIPQDLEIIPFSVWPFHRCSCDIVKAAPCNAVGSFRASMGGPRGDGTPTLGSALHRDFVSFIWRAVLDSLPRRCCFMHCVNIIAANTHEAFSKKKTAALIPLEPVLGKCRYNMMIKGDQSLPGSWHFQYLAAAARPRIARTLRRFILWRANSSKRSSGNMTHESCDGGKLISVIGFVCLCMCVAPWCLQM